MLAWISHWGCKCKGIGRWDLFDWRCTWIGGGHNNFWCFFVWVLFKSSTLPLCQVIVTGDVPPKKYPKNCHGQRIKIIPIAMKVLFSEVGILRLELCRSFILNSRSSMQLIFFHTLWASRGPTSQLRITFNQGYYYGTYQTMWKVCEIPAKMVYTCIYMQNWLWLAAGFTVSWNYGRHPQFCQRLQSV